MAESTIMEEETGADLAEFVRLSLIFALLAIDAWIMWEAVKDRPDVLVMRHKIRDAIAGPWKRYRDQRSAERHVVHEAMMVVDGSEQEAPE